VYPQQPFLERQCSRGRFVHARLARFVHRRFSTLRRVNWIVGLRLFLLVLSATLYKNPTRLTGTAA